MILLTTPHIDVLRLHNVYTGKVQLWEKSSYGTLHVDGSEYSIFQHIFQRERREGNYGGNKINKAVD